VRPVLDLRTYRLVSGGRETFDRIFREGALPMLGRHQIEVVGYGPSLADDKHYYLARAFPSASGREEQLGAFYGSEEWQQGYDSAVSELIETYHTVVVPQTPRITQALASDA
jgi:NIPSNAP